ASVGDSVRRLRGHARRRRLLPGLAARDDGERRPAGRRPRALDGRVDPAGRRRRARRPAQRRRSRGRDGPARRRRGAAAELRRAEPPRGARSLRRSERAARAAVSRGAGAMRRVLALAFDGADYDLVQRLMGEGKLPTISRLAREGTFGPLRSTIPAFTPTAWSTFLTGLN